MPEIPIQAPIATPPKLSGLALIISLFINLFLVITIVFLFIKLQSKPLPAKNTTIAPPSPVETNTTTTIFAEPMVTNSPSFNLIHHQGWQFLQYVDPSPLNGYIFTYTYINFDQPFVTGEFETKNDLQLIIAKAAPEKGSIKTLNQYISDAYPENQAQIQTTVNPNGLEITKWIGMHPLNGEPLTLYFFTIPSPNANYFAQLSINSTITQENLQSLLDSLKIST